MISKRTRGASTAGGGDDAPRFSSPAQYSEKRDEYVGKRDWQGALTLLDFQRQAGGESDVESLAWVGYCAAHAGDYKRAIDAYTSVVRQHAANGGASEHPAHLNVACCYFYLHMWSEAKAAALKGPANALRNRLLFHISHRLNEVSVSFLCVHRV